MKFQLPAFFLIACGTQQQTESKELDETPLAQALQFADPEPLVNLEETLRTQYADSNCPKIEENGAIETWSGGCETESGLRIEGSLKLVSNKWMQADNYSINSSEGPILSFEGGLEKSEHGELLQLDFTGFICGLHGEGCTDGLTQLELSATVYPISDYPENHEVSVYGFINGSEKISFDGSWSHSDETCKDEASEGVFGIWHEERHDLVMDGANACDSCADWSIQGSSAATFCGDLP